MRLSVDSCISEEASRFAIQADNSNSISFTITVRNTLVRKCKKMFYKYLALPYILSRPDPLAFVLISIG